MAVFNEDSKYRMSSQFRLWSFTPGTLASLRRTANHTPAEHIRKRRKTSHPDSHSNGIKAAADAEGSVGARHVTSEAAELQPLHPHEELHLMDHKLIPLVLTICQTWFTHMSSKSRGTAVQYLRRYYLSHSLMEPIGSAQGGPAPLDSTLRIALACVYLTMKVNDEYVGLADFVARVQDKGVREGMDWAASMTVEGMKDAEAVLTRTLRFCFDVRHAADGLRGLEMELTLLAAGKGDPRLAELSRQLQSLSTSEGGAAAVTLDGEESSRALRVRIGDALNTAAVTLKTVVHTSDVYFLYTPSQILFAAFSLADEKLAHWYLSTKFPSAIDPSKPSPAGPAEGDASEEQRQRAFELRDRVFATIRSCAEVLVAARDEQSAGQETRALEARLARCQRVMIGPEDGEEPEGAKSVKRNGVDAGFSSSDEGGEVVDGLTMKRKRRKVEDDDIFGGALPVAQKV